MGKQIILLTFGTLSVLIIACQPASQEVEITAVESGQPSWHVHELEELAFSNCTGDEEKIESLNSLVNVEKLIAIENTSSSRDNGTYELPENVLEDFKAEVDNTYRPVYETEKLRLEMIQIKASPGAQTIYIIQWTLQRYSTIINFSYVENAYKSHGYYELYTPQLLYQEEFKCPELGGTSTATPSQVVSTDADEEVIATELIENGYLYHGPNLTYKRVDEKKISKGETVFIIFRNTTGTWLFVERSDGIRGWLRSVWLDGGKFDLEIIPITTSIAPFPTTIPTKITPEVIDTPIITYP